MGKKIKILFTIPNFDTAGSGKVVYDFVDHLDKSLFEPHICCFHNRGKFFKTVEELNVPIHLFPFSATYRPFISLPFRILNIYRFFRKHKFDLIHSWHWSSDFTEALGAKLSGTPYLYTKKSMGWGNKSWRWKSKLSTKIIVINSDMSPQFFSTMKSKIVPIPLGIDIDYYSPRLPDIKLKHKLGLQADDFVVISVANMVAVKGIEVLIEAVLRLNDNSIKVLLVGDDKSDYAINLKKKYEGKNVMFLGKQLDVRPYIALANIFVIPTKDEGRKEGLPIAPIEAMSMAKVVIGSEISGIKDILIMFPNNLVEPANVNMLSQAIKHLKGLDSDTFSSLENGMRQEVINNYNIKDVIVQHQELYQKLTK